MRTSLCWLALAVAATLGLAGCRRDKPQPPPPASGSAPVARSGSGEAAAGIEVFVNGLSIGRVQPSLLASWPRLDSLVPGDARRLGMWELVSLEGAGAKPTEVPRPSTTYPDLVPAVFPGDGPGDGPGDRPGDGASFGMFDPVELARKGKPALREDHVKAIRIQLAQNSGRGQNDDGGASAGDPAKLVVAITHEGQPSGATQLTGEQILALPREPMPGAADQKGWRLTALLTAAGVKTYQRLVLRDTGGANLTLDRKDVSDTSVPFIKLNKQGVLRLRVLKKTGDGWTPSGDLRGLVSIDVK